MNDKELEIVRQIGVSSFAVYSYVKTFPMSRNVDIEAGLGIHHNTVMLNLRKLEELNIIKREMPKMRIKLITINEEKDWRLQ